MAKPIMTRWALPLAVLGLTAAAAEAETVRVVKAQDVIRSAPSEQGQVVATVVRDDFLEVAEDAGAGWLLVRLPRSTDVGFIQSQSVVVVAKREGSPTSGATRPSAPTARRRWPETTLLVSAAYAPQKVNFSETTAFTMYQESTGRLATSYAYKTAPGLDAALRVGLTPWLGLQAGCELTSRDGSLSSSAQIPHPIVFGRNRSVTQEASGLRRFERAFSFSVAVTHRAGPMRLAAFAGPTYFSVDTDVAERLVFTQSYPFDSADVTVKSSAPLRLTGTATGYHVGASVDWALHRHFGLGLLARYSAAKVDLARPARTTPGVQDASGDQSVYAAPELSPKMDVGGLRLGGGVRVYF